LMKDINIHLVRFKLKTPLIKAGFMFYK